MTRTAALLIATLTLASIAHAQEQQAPSPQLSDEARAELRRLLSEADAHFEAGRYVLAFQGHMALHAEMERLGMPRAPVALWNAGRALANVPGREREARDVLQRFLDGTTALANEADVAEFRSAAVARIAELDARIGTDEPATTSPPTTSTEPTSSAGGSISPVGPIVLGSGIGILGVAVVFGVLAVTHEADLKNRCGGTDCPNTPENHAFYDEMRAFGAVTDVLLIIGGVTSVVGTIVTFTLNEGGRTEASASARARPGGAEVVIAGSF